MFRVHLHVAGRDTERAAGPVDPHPLYIKGKEVGTSSYLEKAPEENGRQISKDSGHRLEEVKDQTFRKQKRPSGLRATSPRLIYSQPGTVCSIRRPTTGPREIFWVQATSRTVTAALSAAAIMVQLSPG